MTRLVYVGPDGARAEVRNITRNGGRFLVTLANGRQVESHGKHLKDV